MTDDAIGWIVVALATYRLARIVALDAITDAMRANVYEWAWDDEHPTEVPNTLPTQYAPTPRAPWRTYVYGLVSCPLCLGVWFAAALYVIWRWWDWMPAQAAIIILAIAGVQCFLATRSDA